MQIISSVLILFLSLSFLLSGCASSNVSRQAARDIDATYENTVGGARTSITTVTDLYQNTNQTSRGAMLGGVIGAAAGGASGFGGVMGAAGGAIMGGAFGAYIDRNTTLIDKIQNRGVEVIILGDQVLLVLRSAQIFDGLTARINPTAYETLNLVSKLIRGYHKMLVKVNAYTDALGSSRINLALSQEQAQNVVRYLWLAGIDTRLIYAEGHGGTNLVEPSNIDYGRGANYRVEISLQQVPV